MAVPSLVPAIGLLAGAVCGSLGAGVVELKWCLPCTAVWAWLAWGRDRRVSAFVALALGFLVAGNALAVDARRQALRSGLRDVLNRHLDGFLLQELGPGMPHEPILVRARLLEDAAPGTDVTILRASVKSVRLAAEWQDAAGGVILSVGGREAASRMESWTAGRTIEVPATFRRPARYLNDGVPDFERALAFDGTTLFASAKSGLLVTGVSTGTVLEEAAGRVRRHVRTSVGRWVGRHDPLSAGIVTAILIGDRSGLPDDVRERLQAAGTYHVIAISGGNIAILMLLSLGLLRLFGIAGRSAAVMTLVFLVAYAAVVIAGSSVWRAAAMASLYLVARALDLRTPGWHALGAAAIVIVCARPLDVLDVGLVLTCGATVALLETAGRVGPRTGWRRIVGWLLTPMGASLAVELALLPVHAWTFSRITSAGLILNLIAVPLMGVVQVAGLLVVACPEIPAVPAVAGVVAHWATTGLVESARLVEAAPWLALRVAPPPLTIVALYYLALGVLARSGGRLRVLAGASVGAALLVVVGALQAPAGSDDRLRLAVFDVGQGEASLLHLPGGTAFLVDAGGAPFGSGSFDIGGRVLASSLRMQGVRTLNTLVLTHGDPDHIGGAAAVIDAFRPDAVWQGVPVPAHAGLQAVLERARASGARVEPRRAGETRTIGGVTLRVLHPPEPDWERPKVRNDDSVVIEVRFGDVAILLTGDIGADVERTLLPRLTDAPIRVLKVGHHGSRTSTSQALLDAWRPQVAMISVGRGNTFGHPHPDVVRRLVEAGTSLYRTDRNGQITLDTDGRTVRITTRVPS